MVVGGPFYILPLIPCVHRDDEFYVLALSQNSVKLWHCNSTSCVDVELDDVPKDFESAMMTHEHHDGATYNTRRTSKGAWRGMFEGHGVEVDDQKEDLRQYCRQVAHGLQPVLRNKKCPLVLAAVDFLHPFYQSVNNYKHLLEEGIRGNPDRLSAKELHEKGWSLVKPILEKSRQEAVAQFEQFNGTSHATCGSRTVVPAAIHGILDTLFVGKGIERWGRFDAATGEVIDHGARQPGDQELMNLAASHAVKHSGRVFVLNPEQMPMDTTIADVLRRPIA